MVSITTGQFQFCIKSELTKGTRKDVSNENATSGNEQNKIKPIRGKSANSKGATTKVDD